MMAGLSSRSKLRWVWAAAAASAGGAAAWVSRVAAVPAEHVLVAALLLLAIVAGIAKTGTG